MRKPKFKVGDWVNDFRYGSAEVTKVSQKGDDIVYFIKYLARDGAPHSSTCGEEYLTLLEMKAPEIFNDSVVRWLSGT